MRDLKLIDSTVESIRGSEPVIAIKIEWSSGTSYYAEKNITIDGNLYMGYIIELNTLNSDKADVNHTFSFSIFCKTTDYNNIIVESLMKETKCTIYLHYPGVGQTELIRGHLIQPLTWNEEEKILNINIESYLKSETIGYSLCEDDLPETTDYTKQDASANGQFIPFTFGTVKRVPGVRISRIPDEPVGGFDGGDKTDLFAKYIVDYNSDSLITNIYAILTPETTKVWEEFMSWSNDNWSTIKEYLTYSGYIEIKPDLWLIPKTVVKAGFNDYTNWQANDCTLNNQNRVQGVKTWVFKLYDEFDTEVYFSVNNIFANISSKILDDGWYCLILEHLINNYTNLTIDINHTWSWPFRNQKTMNFTFFEQWDAWELCKEISWQYCCALNIKENEVEILNLPKINNERETLNLDIYKVKNIGISFSDYENIYTKIQAKWQKDYTGLDNHIYKYENNVDLYGEKILSKDFFALTNEDDIKICVGFWGYRYSNIWRTLSLETFLQAVKLEPYDVCNINLIPILLINIQGEIENMSYNPVEKLINLNLTLASKAGDNDGYFAFSSDNNYWTGDPNHPIP